MNRVPNYIVNAVRNDNLELVSEYIQEGKIKLNHASELLQVALNQNNRDMVEVLQRGFPAQTFDDIIQFDENQEIHTGFDIFIDMAMNNDIIVELRISKFRSTTTDPDLIKHYLLEYLGYIMYRQEQGKVLDPAMVMALKYYFFKYLNTAQEYDEDLLDLLNSYLSNYLYTGHGDVLKTLRSHTAHPEILNYFERVYHYLPSYKIVSLHNELAELEQQFKDLYEQPDFPYKELVLSGLNTTIDLFQYKLNKTVQEYHL